MPTYDSTFDNRPGNDAEWQAFIQNYEAALLASGFLEVAPDTGQIDPLTVARPVSTSTYAGYRIYRAVDAEAAVRPLYLKVEYGVSGFVDRPQIRRSVGTGSNGSGTLTGPVTSLTTPYVPSNDGSGAGWILGGGDEHCAWLWTWDPSSTHTTLLMVGRFLDPETGDPDTGIIWETNVNSTSATLGTTYLFTDGAAAWASVANGLLAHFPDVSGGPQNGGDVNTTRLFEGLVYRNAKALVWPMLAGRSGELPFTNAAESMINLNVWGRMRTFLPISSFTAYASGNRLILPWEP